MKRLIKFVSIITLAFVAVFGVSASVANAQTANPTGVQVSNASALVGIPTYVNGQVSSYPVTFSYTLTAGNQPIYESVNYGSALQLNVTGLAGVQYLSSTANPSTILGDNLTKDISGYYLIPAGQTRTFTWSGTINSSIVTSLGMQTIQLTGVYYGTTATNMVGSNSSTIALSVPVQATMSFGGGSNQTPTTTPPLPPTPTTTPTTVAGLYQQYLARTPDAAGLAYWMGQPLDQVKAGILSSVEYASRRIQIARLYYQLLGRPADAAGLDYWANNGLTIDQIRQGIMNSQEYLLKGNTSVPNTCPDGEQLSGTACVPSPYGGRGPDISPTPVTTSPQCPAGYVCTPIIPTTAPTCPTGYVCTPITTTTAPTPISTPVQVNSTTYTNSTYTNSSLTTSDEVRQAYRDILDRDPALDGDSAGLQAWTGLALTDSQLRSGIANSFEGQTKTQITGMFEKILGRDPAPYPATELNDWYMKAYNHDTGALNLDIVRNGLGGTVTPTATPVPPPTPIQAPTTITAPSPVMPVPVPNPTPITAPPSTTVATPVVTPVTIDQVGQLYTSLLYRTGNTSELSYWANSGMNLSAIKSAISASIEATTKAKIAALYQSLLNRAPDTAGMTNWYNIAQQNNYNTDVVKAGIMQSVEYQNLHPASAVPVTTTKSNQTTSVFDAIRNFFGL